MDHTVALISCTCYEADEVSKAVKQGLDYLGGWERYIKPGQRVLLKANLLTKRPPEDAVTTHPSVVRAVAEEVIRAGGEPFIYDSPGGPFTSATLKDVYQGCGLASVAGDLGIELNFDLGSTEVPTPKDALVRSLTLSRAVCTADVVINLPKLKSHGLTRYTGAVKNLYGCIPGLRKADYHLQFPELHKFAGFLLDLALTVKPALTIMDAVVAMEGEGPSAGTPRELGFLLASPSVFALDAVAVTLIGLDVAEVPTTRLAEQRGLLTVPVVDTIAGLKLKDVIVGDFEVPSPGGTSFRFLGYPVPPQWLKLAGGLLGARPVFNPNLCRQCGICVRSCPANAIALTNKGPKVDLAACIRCFCCQELCPEQAVAIHRSWLSQRLLKW